MSALRIRPAVYADAAPVAVLVTQLGYPSDAAQMLARMRRVQDDPGIRMLVAENDAGIIGMIGLMVFPAFHRDGLHGYIGTALAVEEAVRGSGAGAALLEAAEAWFIGRGVTKATLTTAAHRERAHRFYEKHGYEFNGRRYVKDLT